MWTPAQNVCRVYPLSTGNQDNIDCESGIIFDNDEDKTDSAALLPCIEQAREDIRILRQLQFLQQNR
ncbi:TPA: DUF957 domain-containing protein [Escherichia coli]|nr:DUF957 domain-containing protein [Escherichia coli]